MELKRFHVTEPALVRGEVGCEKFIRKEDKLGVKKFVEHEIKNMLYLRDGVLGLVAPYGSGKSFILNYIYCYFSTRLNENVIYIDISKFEYDKNILKTILLHILREHKVRSSLREWAKKALPTVTKLFVKRFLNIENSDYKELQELIEVGGEKFSEVLIELFNEEEHFKRQLREVVKDSRLIVIIDNLDRCKPDFVLYFLSYIKEVLEIENILFIIAYDKRQLINYIKSQYGAEIDEQNFLKKYIPVDIHLPVYSEDDIKNFVRSLLDVNLDKANIEVSDILKDLTPKIENFLSKGYRELMGLSLRKIEVICKKLNNFCDLIPQLHEFFKKNTNTNSYRGTILSENALNEIKKKINNVTFYEIGEKGDLKETPSPNLTLLVMIYLALLILEQIDYTNFYRLRNLERFERSNNNNNSNVLESENTKKIFQLMFNTFGLLLDDAEYKRKIGKLKPYISLIMEILFI